MTRWSFPLADGVAPPATPQPAAASSVSAIPIRRSRMCCAPLPVLGQPRPDPGEDEDDEEDGRPGQDDVPAAQAVVAGADRLVERATVQVLECDQRRVVVAEVAG